MPNVSAPETTTTFSSVSPGTHSGGRGKDVGLPYNLSAGAFLRTHAEPGNYECPSAAQVC
jgi:hypothetical protein